MAKLINDSLLDVLFVIFHLLNYLTCEYISTNSYNLYSLAYTTKEFSPKPHCEDFSLVRNFVSWQYVLSPILQ
jgi:hypothetical protein